MSDGGTFLCRLDDVPDEGSVAVRGPHGGETKILMVLRRGDEVFVYVNSCPHNRAPLDIEPGRFLDITGTRILCANHGALFRIEDGKCLQGPCRDKGLVPVPVEVRGRQIFAIP